MEVERDRLMQPLKDRLAYLEELRAGDIDDVGSGSGVGISLPNF